jgi:hypothetical protein
MNHYVPPVSPFHVKQNMGARLENLGLNMKPISEAPFEGQSMDEFNSDKSLLRLTMDRVPHSLELYKSIGVPLAILVKPFGDLPGVPRCDFG